MSGIRLGKKLRVLLLNPGHPQTFWSYDQVMRMLRKKALLPPLGLLTVAALLPPEWRLKLVDQTFQETTAQDWEDCDLVFISGMVVQHRGILENIREGKRRGKTVVVGGPWAFHFPADALAAGADLVVKGEAENVMPQLLQSLRDRESGRVIVPTEFADLEKSPPPRYDLININHYANMSLQFSRGCPFQCDFCDITLMLGRRVRTKSPRQILAELQHLYDLGWRGGVFIVDDNFIGNPGRARSLLQELLPWMISRGRPFDFFTQASVNLAAYEDILELLVETGFTCLFLGIETLDVESLKQAKKSQNVGVDLDAVCDRINRAGLLIWAGCIIGFDMERPGADRRLLDFARRRHIPEMFITLLQAAPGTELWSRLEREGRLVSVDHEHLSNQTGVPNFKPTRPMAQIVEEFIHLYQVLYEPKFYLERVVAYLARMETLPPKKPFRWPRLSEIRAVLILFWRQGLLSSSRRQFWQGLLSIAWYFPARLHNFLCLCVHFEHFYDYQHTITTTLRRQLAQREPDQPWALPPLEMSSTLD
jgi:radical SAM superfamily enzyme YgiQ (UPF0313 family)